MTKEVSMMPFIDLAAQQKRLKSELDEAISSVLAHGKYIMGPEVKELEQELASFIDSKHCISVSNGTDALIAGLMAYEVGPGDAIITTPFTFFATVEAILLLGATPVFADIDPITFNICPQEIKRVISKTKQDSNLNLRGIISVDLFGLPADYATIGELAKENDLFVIQDSAQACGATYQGKRCPAHGDIGTTSFFPAKPLGCYGDGGAMFTDDDELAEKLRSIRVHGKGVDKYDNVRVGKNARLDTIQAAILLCKLRIYEDELGARRAVAATYADELKKLNESLPDSLKLTAPVEDESHLSAWAQYSILCQGDRDAISACMKKRGIPTLVYYRTPSHLLGACESLGYKRGEFSIAENASQQILALPFHPYLGHNDVSRVVSGLGQVLESQKA